jgi:hypothetical protein
MPVFSGKTGNYAGKQKYYGQPPFHMCAPDESREIVAACPRLTAWPLDPA